MMRKRASEHNARVCLSLGAGPCRPLLRLLRRASLRGPPRLLLRLVLLALLVRGRLLRLSLRPLPLLLELFALAFPFGFGGVGFVVVI